MREFEEGAAGLREEASSRTQAPIFTDISESAE